MTYTFYTFNARIKKKKTFYTFEGIIAEHELGFIYNTPRQDKPLTK